MRGIIIIIIMFFKNIYKESFFRKTEKSQIRSQHILKRFFTYFCPQDRLLYKALPQFFARRFKGRRFVMTAALSYACNIFLTLHLI